MSPRTILVACFAFGAGASSNVLLSGKMADKRPHDISTDRADAAAPSPDDLAELRADIERLKEKATDQAHVMVSVDYHFNNLWFAAQRGNWSLAQFYLNESKSHLRWAVRVIPIRKDNQGQEVNLPDILQAVENSPLKRLDDAIEAKDGMEFVDAYKFMLEACYACHKAADKPYLRPHIPEQPAASMVNFDPNAEWPK